MLRKIFLALLLTMGFCQLSIAQKDGSDPELRAVKVGLFTDRMHLTQQQSEKFWPLYFKYETEMRSEVWRKKREVNASNMEARKKVDMLQELEEKKTQIRGKFKNEFLKVISASQLTAMYQAETEFKNMLLKRLGNSN